MRDPKRIPRILALLSEVWELEPDWRLGQLYANLVGHHRDVFYIEDDEVEQALLKIHEQRAKRNEKGKGQ